MSWARCGRLPPSQDLRPCTSSQTALRQDCLATLLHSELPPHTKSSLIATGYPEAPEKSPAKRLSSSSPRLRLASLDGSPHRQRSLSPAARLAALEPAARPTRLGRVEGRVTVFHSMCTQEFHSQTCKATSSVLSLIQRKWDLWQLVALREA